MQTKYNENILYFDDYNLLDIALTNKTPFYLYSENKIIENFNDYKAAFSNGLTEHELDHVIVGWTNINLSNIHKSEINYLESFRKKKLEYLNLEKKNLNNIENEKVSGVFEKNLLLYCV